MDRLEFISSEKKIVKVEKPSDKVVPVIKTDSMDDLLRRIVEQPLTISTIHASASIDPRYGPELLHTISMEEAQRRQVEGLMYQRQREIEREAESRIRRIEIEAQQIIKNTRKHLLYLSGSLITLGILIILFLKGR